MTELAAWNSANLRARYAYNVEHCQVCGEAFPATGRNYTQRTCDECLRVAFPNRLLHSL